MRTVLRLAWTCAACLLWSFVLVTFFALPAHRPVTHLRAPQTIQSVFHVKLAAAHHPVVVPPRLAAWDWALRQEGCWYSYGGTSCAMGFDCSGLVMQAYAHAGIWLPRTTYEMLADPRLHRVWHPHTGVLAFYGAGHVELYAWGHTTFGAHDSGSRVGFTTEWEMPAYYYVWGS